MYFLLAPHATDRQVEEAAKAGRDLPLDPRQVLRVSADGKTRMSFDPARSSKLANTKRLTTLQIAVDQQGTLFLLVWATWDGLGSQAEKGGQYIVSFNEKGEYQSQVEIDWQEINVQQFEVFGSGQFLLRGRRTHTSEPRIAILSETGKLQDVTGWAGYSSELLDVSADGADPPFDHMVRGGDGRIYVAEQDAQQDKVAVYAFGPYGDTEAVFALRPMPKNRQLLGFRSAGDRFAAMYLEARPQRANSDGQGGQRWWINVYNNALDGELQSVYGPVPAPPVCYQRTGSEDRFTFLTDGDKLVAMAP